MMTDARVMSIDELKAFLASSDVLTFKGSSREETYGWIERTLRTYSYFSRPRSEKGLIRSHMEKITGLSAAELTRLIKQFRRTRQTRYIDLTTHQATPLPRRPASFLVCFRSDSYTCCMNRTLLIAAGLGWSVTILGASAILYVVKRWPFYAREDGRAIGGLALVLGILVGGAVIIPSIDPFLLLGSEVIILIGLIDDRIDLSPWQKLVGQGIAAALATAGLSSIQAVSLGGPLPLGSVQWIVTFLWILTLINAANLIDGLDGLLITVLAPSFGALAIVAILGKNVTGGALSLAALCALLGFYPLNRHHGRLLLGDTGAEFIGYLLALLTLAIFQREEGEWAVVPALLIAAVPLSDTTFAVLRRLVHHRSIFQGDREHIHHRLAAHRGEKKAVTTLGIVSLFTSVLAFLLWQYGA